MALLLSGFHTKKTNKKTLSNIILFELHLWPVLADVLYASLCLANMILKSTKESSWTSLCLNKTYESMGTIWSI